MQNSSDVLIVGGGPIGLLLALGLGQQGMQVRLLEAQPLQDETASHSTNNAFDGRVLALSFGSIEVLHKLGVWQALKPFATAIEHVHVSQKGYLGITTLHAREMGVNALGFSVQGRDLGRVLWQAVQAQSAVEVFAPAVLEGFSDDANQPLPICAQVLLDGALQEFYARLIIGADGTQSMVRQTLGLALQEKSYDAYAVLAQIETEQHPQGWSYERFTLDGPVALLPMNGHQHKAVMVIPQTQLAEVMALDDQAYLQKFADKMGERLGGFVGISPRLAYPLKEAYVDNFTQGHALLLGNAAHTQHPVAAQGLNLGIRDIAVLLNQIEQLNLPPTQSVEQLSSQKFLQNYAALRQPDHQNVLGMTDSLISVFQHSSPLVGHLRGLGLMALQALPAVKKRFSRFAMGKG
ncbi:2-octaprenyl-6-methoxyphenyl hydroxylase [Thiosulfatimonas sediminis]|uniref:2-octaprenyl-6-methoxyphenyl hydroxylase n=1 Tax=Thiosulfatimonas sediminis TaxID=2675054 RepID=A0A6F8PU99_9GAMM|nr:FAD-dependent monooxygenase [Thiosulfatimonas sediminis]BBP45676.1 2-octaprenyl-6-methoxyphenyl hydroxylase [Thiosulfatimonas sediminis]